MSELNTLLEAFKAFILTYITSALESALESIEGRLERLEEEGGRCLTNEVDDLERGQIANDSRLDDLESDVRALFKRLNDGTCTSGDIRDIVLAELEESEAEMGARLGRLEDRIDRLEATVQAERDGEPARFTALLRNTLYTVDGGAPVLGAKILEDNEDDDGEAFDALVRAWEGGAGSAPLRGPWGSEVRLWEPSPAPLADDHLRDALATLADAISALKGQLK
jgi:predicted RNase H-like nuclease (RuvC/YqgF family)